MASIFWYTHSWGTIFLAIDFGYIVVVTAVFAKTEYLDLDPEPRLEMGISTNLLSLCAVSWFTTAHQV